MQVPLVDLGAQLKTIHDDVMKGIGDVVRKGNFTLGEEVRRFEQDFSRFSGAKFGVGVANGTDALELALRALDIGPGDEVVLPANTFIATAVAVSLCGAKPVLVDIDPRTYLLDLTLLEQALTPKTKAVIPVHLYGRMLEMKPLEQLATKHGFAIIEDACQSHGAVLGGRKAGSVGAMGCFSFYPGKNLGAFGDAGMVVTSDPALHAKLEAIRTYGSTKKYHHPIFGKNSRLDTIQAAVLLAKFPYLEKNNQARYQAAVKFNQLLEGVGDLRLPEISAAGSHVFHLYVVRTAKRDALLEHLNKNGVGAGIHYPFPIHKHGAYAHLGYDTGSFPVSEQFAGEILSLPIYPEITDEQIGYIAQKTKEYFSL